jgi:hypothetical protein
MHTATHAPTRERTSQRSEEIASCSEAAYVTLKLADAQKLMMFKSVKETEAYAKQVCELHAWACVAGGVVQSRLPARQRLPGPLPTATPFLLANQHTPRTTRTALAADADAQRGWRVEGGTIHFAKAAAGQDESGAGHMALINHTLVYAKELERIV